jgi:hypothetical protein
MEIPTPLMRSRCCRRFLKSETGNVTMWLKAALAKSSPLTYEVLEMMSVSGHSTTGEAIVKWSKVFWTFGTSSKTQNYHRFSVGEKIDGS